MNIKKLFTYIPDDESDFEVSPAVSDENYIPQKNNGGPELGGNYRENIETLSKELCKGKSGDLKTRDFTIKINERNVNATIFFIDGLVNKQIINDFILKPLMLKSREINVQSFRSIYEILLPQCEATETNLLGKLSFNINFGSVILLVEGMRQIISLDVKGWQHRGVESPQTERVIRGPNDAFSEQLRENTALIRHIIRNKSLVSTEFPVGKISQTPVSVMYIENVANESLVKETVRRVKSIDADYIFAAAEIEQFIENKTFSTLPQFLSTERPDRAARALLDGKIVIVVDGSPFVTILPTTFFELNESAEDNYLRFPYVNMIKTIRWVSFLLSLFLPGIYIAVVNFHTELLPTDILLSIISTREKVPFPTLIEIIIMEISLEIIREAAVRVPEASGSTLSIVGALILGQAAVTAGIVSPILIIVVSLTAIGSFATPNYYLALTARLLRFLYILLGALGGFLGITVGVCINVLRWTGVKSMGVPMAAPFAPLTEGEVPAVYLPPIWRHEFRDDYINTKRKKKQPHISRKWLNNDNQEGNS